MGMFKLTGIHPDPEKYLQITRTFSPVLGTEPSRLPAPPAAPLRSLNRFQDTGIPTSRSHITIADAVLWRGIYELVSA